MRHLAGVIAIIAGGVAVWWAITTAYGPGGSTASTMTAAAIGGVAFGLGFVMAVRP